MGHDPERPGYLGVDITLAGSSMRNMRLAAATTNTRVLTRGYLCLFYTTALTLVGVNVGTVFAANDSVRSALETDPKGWTDLLAVAGPKLDGWVRGPIPPEAKLNARSQWFVDPTTGYLVCRGDGGHEWLRWNDELSDFVFHVEWRFTPIPEKKGYNSGIYARNSIDARTWHQAQTGDHSGGFIFGASPKNGMLKGFNLAKQQPTSRVKPAGEWNTFEIACSGREMSLWVNGADVNRWLECEVPKGYVGLEAEGYRIEFRSVKVKPFPKTSAANNDVAVKVGAAMRVITPSPLLPVSGGMGVPRPVHEQRGELTAPRWSFKKETSPSPWWRSTYWAFHQCWAIGFAPR